MKLKNIISLILMLLLVFSFVSCKDEHEHIDKNNDRFCDECQLVLAEPEKLTTPNVTISKNGVAGWATVANASGYAYKINGGEEKTITATSVQLADGDKIVVKALGDNQKYSDSDYSAEKNYTKEVVEPTKLNAPVVSVSEDTGIASWDAVDNASYYIYKINDGEEKTTEETSVQLADGDKIVVKAVGDGANFTDSDYSEEKTYTAKVEPQKLDAPVVTINDSGLAGWNTIANATGYVYKVNGGEEQTTTATSLQLADGDKIVVKAVGNGETFLDSDFSEEKTYTAPEVLPEDPTPVKLGTPVVTISENGVASFSAVENATGYIYKINDGNEISTTETSVQLANGDRIVVKAVGDGANFTDSDYSEEKTYTAKVEPQKLNAPTVTINDSGLAGWNTIANATGYVYKINGGEEKTTTATSLQLADGDKIVVKAVGNGETFLDSDFSEEKTYTAKVDPVKLATPSVTISNSGLASWNAIANVTYYIYKINGGEEKTTTDTSVQLADGDKIVVKAVGDGANFTDSDYSEEKTYVVKGDPQKLGTPIASISDDGLVTWTSVANATAYVYKIDDGDEIRTTETSIRLEKEQNITIKAVGDGVDFIDSDFSTKVAYQCNHEAHDANSDLVCDKCGYDFYSDIYKDDVIETPKHYL